MKALKLPDGLHEFMAIAEGGWATGATQSEACSKVAALTKGPVERVLIVPRGAQLCTQFVPRVIAWEALEGHGSSFCPLCVVK